MSSVKKWVLTTLISILLSLSAIVGFDYYIDPLWTFEHDSKYSNYQRGRKEREQKSHALYFREKKYNTLIFGSSRTAHMNQHKFDEETFNYSASDMQPNEYAQYLDFAIHEANQPIKRVIIGLDFFGALQYSPKIATRAKGILNEITKPFYRYKQLLSIDTFSYSMQNVKYYLNKEQDTYSADYIRRCPPKSKLDLITFNKNINAIPYRRDRYSTPYDENYKQYIDDLVNSHPDIEFIVFTTPVSEKHFKLLVSMNQYANYERWLKESVEVFKNINHYMYINDITEHANLYFSDSNHMYNSSYTCIAYQLQGKPSQCPNVAMKLTPLNIEKKLKLLRKLNLK